MHASKLNDEAKDVIARYARRELSAREAAYVLWEGQLTPGEPDPSIHDVIFWGKELGFGVPSESHDEALESARRAVERFSG